MNEMAKVVGSGSLSMASQTATPAEVLDNTSVAKALRSAKRRIIAALYLGFLDEWVDNDPDKIRRLTDHRCSEGLSSVQPK